jgi:hypothetical protein
MDAPQLLQLLQATLDANPNTRLQAELHLAQASRSSGACGRLKRSGEGSARRVILQLTVAGLPPQRRHSDSRDSQPISKSRFPGDRFVTLARPASLPTMS